MDTGHALQFAALSVLNIPISGWTCQVIDGVKNQNKWDKITGYQGTDYLKAVVSGFKGPYTMEFTVTDNGSPLTVLASVMIGGPSSLDVNGSAAPPPENNKPQIDPGIDLTGSQVWNRWESGSALRELRFHTSLNTSEIIAELEKLGVNWLATAIKDLLILK